MSRAWQLFVDGYPARAEDVTMAVWACLFNDGQAMDIDDQVSPNSVPVTAPACN